MEKSGKKEGWRRRKNKSKDGDKMGMEFGRGVKKSQMKHGRISADQEAFQQV